VQPRTAGLVREHAAQHDAIGDLPLVTESATVTAVERMDRDRRPEIRETVSGWLDARGPDLEGPTTDPDSWDRLRAALADADHPRLARRVATVAERYRRPKPMLVRVGLRTARPLEFLAGQYVGLRYGDHARAYSLASSPTDDELELCVRRVPGGRLSPRIAGELSPGEAVTLRGPHGDLVLDDHGGRDLAFMATGTGVAPLRSMLRYLFATGRDDTGDGRRDVWLFLGAGWLDDLPYHREFRELAAERANFHYVPTLSRESVLGDWDGETDYVQHAFLKHVDPATVTAGVDGRVERWLGRRPDSGVDARLDPARTEVYACGVNAMVHGLVASARAVGVPERHVASEGFG